MCKKFIMSPGGVDRYEGVDVRIVKGHNPDLVVVDGAGDKRIDLTPYATEAALHALMKAQGFVERRGDDANKVDGCYDWRESGECLKNEVFMRENCALACRGLKNRNELCDNWAQQGECEANPVFMYPECPLACGWKTEL